MYSPTPPEITVYFTEKTATTPPRFINFTVISSNHPLSKEEATLAVVAVTAATAAACVC
jgi:hypothetical protein